MIETILDKIGIEAFRNLGVLLFFDNLKTYCLAQSHNYCNNWINELVYFEGFILLFPVIPQTMS